MTTLSGNSFEWRPRSACSPARIENARLLLLSNSVAKAGLGNGNDLVGRYFMEHVHVPGRSRSSRWTTRRRSPPIHEPRRRGRPYARHPDAVGRLLRREKRLCLSVTIYPQRAAGDGAPVAESSIQQGVAAARAYSMPGERYFWRVLFRHEPIPSPDNHVTLGDGGDALGQRPCQLIWRPTSTEHRELARNVDAAGASFGAGDAA